MRLLFLSFLFSSLSLAQEAAPVPVEVVLPADVAAASLKPNVILIVADDLGYSDIGCYGSKTIRTPFLDRMAAEGTRFTSFTVAQAVCSASRAALMTGCYPNRVGMQGALNHTSLEGIHPDEFLMPELFKQRGYATAIHGKWHLGTAAMFHPMKHGFDEFWGIPYSNDNSKYHPSLAAEMPPLPVYDNEKVEATDPDQSLFTRRITEKAVSFIRRNEKKPFFLYVPHIMPHVPIFASARFKGKSPHGLYADVVEELDWSVGMILAAVEQAGVAGNTLVIFMSDNGPFLSYGNYAGNAAPLREGKLTSYDGGVRVPFIALWPGHVPAGKVNDEVLTAMDLMPTFMAWNDEAGSVTPPVPVEQGEGVAETKEVAAESQPATTPAGAAVPVTAAPAGTPAVSAPVAKTLDGKDVMNLLLGKEGAKSPHEAIAVYAGGELQAIRSGDWKLHFAHPFITPHETPGLDGKPSNWENMKPAAITQSGIEGIATRHGYKVAEQTLALFNLKDDLGETTDVSAAHPEVVERLQKLAEDFRQQLGDSLTKTVGTGVRPLGRAETMDGAE
ncbi:arylsulfatase A-like enzyme [Prosthecobacter fusiformis]|uniref:Arylsulfatase A-like enzyme n=1 Tax=Prosthecobacter fusiformis TaxID=48464 RepID=A0A4R7RP62_9BACT|nr:sulfatase [Prosthecobacter fusiformis]TDU66608.1 arylsulfatase A-like enzyme [Prosthecobacter fusiformis]